MDYELKANLTTILSTYLIPALIGAGVAEGTANAIAGILISVIIIGIGMLNERYVSSHLTKDNADNGVIMNNNGIEDSVNDDRDIVSDNDKEEIYDDVKSDVPSNGELESIQL